MSVNVDVNEEIRRYIMKILYLLLVTLFVSHSFAAIHHDKKALVHFEMGNYFLQGGDWDNAIKYYNQARGKLGMDEMEVVLCRNMANAFMMKDDTLSTEKLLGSCIAKFDYKKIQEWASLREIFKVYAQIQADRVNPEILNKKRQMVKARMQAIKGNRSVNLPAQKKEGPKLGFK